jgi:hypothetical protein
MILAGPCLGRGRGGRDDPRLDRDGLVSLDLSSSWDIDLQARMCGIG